MNFNSDNSSSDPRKALASARLLWAAMLAGMAIFAVVVAFAKPGPKPQSEQDPAIQTLFYINCGMLFVGLFVGYVLRNQYYKKFWEGEVVKPKGYLQGNLLLWAIAEGFGMLSLCIVLMSGSFYPYGLPAVGAAMSLLLNFPNGQIMFPPRENLT